MKIRPVERSAIWKNSIQVLVPLMILALILSACTKKSTLKEDISEDLGEPTEKTAEDVRPAEEMETAEPEPASVPEEDTEPEPKPDPDPDPEPTPFPMFDIIDGQTIMLSITEEAFLEYADFLKKELNLNNAAAAGILANIQCESGFNPNKVGDSGSAYGLCQWHGARLDQMVQYCEENGLNPVTLEGQLQFLVHDLRDVYIYAYDQVRLCQNSEAGALQATYYFCALYEVPSDPESESVVREELTKLLIYPRLCELREEKNG